jgi:CubicO group peptidase (beta-lactamase class C family)
MERPAVPIDVSALDLAVARAVADREVASGRLPCAVLGCVDAAGRRFSHVSRRPDDNVAEHSVFFLASVSKAIVATAVMQYVDEGRLDVHAPLRRYLPELAGSGVDDISAWHVLTHTSGLPDIPVETLRRQRPAHDRLFDVVAASRPGWPPGSRYEYNSAAWILLAEAMARLSGMPFASAMELRLLGPLGMADTTFDGRPMRGRIVAMQGSRNDNRLVQEVLLRFLARARMPGGGLFGSLDDLLRLGRSLLPRDPDVPGPRVLTQAAIDEMGRQQAEGLNHVGLDGRAHEIHQALGWRKPQPGWPGSSAVMTHGGISGARIWVDPQAGFAFAFLTNVWQAPLEPVIEILEAIYRARG